MSKKADKGRCGAIVEKTGKRCSKKAVNGHFCKIHSGKGYLNYYH
jgi:hypothetical protein